MNRAAMLTGLLADRTADLLETPESRARFADYLTQIKGVAGMGDYIAAAEARLAAYDTDPSSPGCLPPAAAEAVTGGTSA